MDMAATQTQTTSPPSGQISIYGHGQPSPANSATATPASNSPTSPRLPSSHLYQFPLQSRQLRPPKAPLYVPAVLRPTERPSKPTKSSPPTPPRSVHGSLDSLNHDGEPAPTIIRHTTVESNDSGISKLAVDEWMKDEDLGEVTGSPTRDHWKADSASPTCDSPACRSFFGLFVRRHHCRHCGHVFCSSHTPNMVPLDQNARFHPSGIPSRACDQCYRAYRGWEDDRVSRLDKIQRDITAQHHEDAASLSDSSSVSMSRSRGNSGDGKAMLAAALGGRAEAVASSVPRDWNWSTF